MVGRPKKIENDGNSNGDSDLREQVKLLQEKLNILLSKDSSGIKEDESDDVKIPQDDYIKVMNIKAEPLTLSTKEYGQGVLYNFQNFGQIKKIIYSDLVKIMEVHPNFLNEGFFYILDKRVIRSHGLDEVYENILTKDQIQDSLNNLNECVELFKVANDNQRKLIIDMLIDKIVEGHEVDRNLIDKLARISNIKIEDIIVDRTFVEELLPKTNKK
jgi:hypothetical protein